MGEHSDLIRLHERKHADAECIEEAGPASLESSTAVISLGRMTNTTSTFCTGNTDLLILDHLAYFTSSALITSGVDSRIFMLY